MPGSIPSQPFSPESSSAVQVTVAELVRLRQQASMLPIWPPAAIRATQSGLYSSSHKGRGMEFHEVRPYQPGDDVRTIDWRVTARTGRAHTKLFCEERERPVLVAVDYRPSMFFATRGSFKSVFAAKTAALLAWSANQHADRVGGVIFDGLNHHEFKPQRSKSSILHFLKQLGTRPPHHTDENPEALEQVTGRLRRVARPGSLVFIISDFRHFGSRVESDLALMSRHNDIVLLFVHDPLECRLPPAGRYRLTDGSTDVTIDTGSKRLKIRYESRFRQLQDRLQSLARNHGMLFLSCSTMDEPLSLLQKGLGLNSNKPPQTVRNNATDDAASMAPVAAR